jgi:hypothetical protein
MSFGLTIDVGWLVSIGRRVLERRPWEKQALRFFDHDHDAMFEHQAQSRAPSVRTSVALWPGATPSIRMTSPDELPVRSARMR